MIKIRYRDSNELSPGLHAAAERHGRSTTVYLLSGLTAQERRAALRRLRLSARMGYCPRLPAGQLALAQLADQIRITIGQAGAVFRLHPAGSTVPVMVISGGAIAFLVLSTVSIRVLPGPRTATQSSAWGTLPVASASALPISGPVPGTSQGPAAGLGGQGNGASTSRGNSGSGSGGSGSGGSETGGGTTLSGDADPTPTPTSAAAASTTPVAVATTPAAATSSSAPPKPAPSANSSSPGDVCVDVGALGICLDL